MKTRLLLLPSLLILIASLVIGCGSNGSSAESQQSDINEIFTEIEVTRIVELTVEVPVEVTRLVETEVTRIIEVEKEITVTVTPEPIPTLAPAPDKVEVEMTEMQIWPASGSLIGIILFATNPSFDYAIESSKFDFIMTDPDGALLDTNIDIVEIPPGGRVPVYTVMDAGDHSIEDINVEVEADGRYVPANQYPEHKLTISDISQPSSDKLLGFITNEGILETSSLMKMVLVPYDDAGIPLGYEYTYPDAMAPSESTTFEFSLFGDRFSQMSDYEIFMLP